MAISSVFERASGFKVRNSRREKTRAAPDTQGDRPEPYPDGSHRYYFFVTTRNETDQSTITGCSNQAPRVVAAPRAVAIGC